MIRWPSLLSGAICFLAAHMVEVVLWGDWFSTGGKPFFLNSGRAVALTTASVLVSGFLAALLGRDRRDVLIHAGNVTVGAAAAMIAALFWIGPGNLFPIVIVIGTAILAAGSFLGALATFPFKPASGATGETGRGTEG